MDMHTSPWHGEPTTWRPKARSVSQTEGADDLLPFPDAPIHMKYSTDDEDGFYTIPCVSTQTCEIQSVPVQIPNRSEGQLSDSSTMTNLEDNRLSSLDMRIQDLPLRRLSPVLQDIASLMLNKLNVVIVGHIALRAYGLDQEVDNTVQVAVKSSHFRRVKQYLLSNGYFEEDFLSDSDSTSTYQTPSISSDLLVDSSCRLVRQTAGGPVYLTLSDAAVWNLSLGTEYKRSIQTLPHTHIPFLKFDVYLKAVLRTSAGLYRGRSAATMHYATRGIDDIAKKMIAICPPEIKASLKPADRFMAKYLPCRNKTRDWESYVCQQAIMIYLHEISFKEAESRLPRVDSVMQAFAESPPKSLKQKKFWRKESLMTDPGKDQPETGFITLIEPRSSVNPKHRVVYRFRRVVDRISRDRQPQVKAANVYV